ncbi:hypothetical protein [Curtobacterium sp. B8]|uniref:hypothetical protein n=1 Tax=Curtobacterium sp. B8 TaxID=95611 RepID=UPI0003B40317|nr:hypothetical protein [Curtobacterium sp. B8]
MTTTPLEPAESIEVEHALQETLDAMRDAEDLSRLLERLTSLKERRDALRSAPVEPILEVIETGRTFADSWAAAEGDVAAQGSLLADGVAAVLVAPGRAGRRPFAMERDSLFRMRPPLPAGSYANLVTCSPRC